MTKFLEYKSTITYYDGPEVILALDHLGGNYVGMAVDSDKTVFKFLVVGITPNALYLLRTGEVDLRSVLVDSAKYGWYFCETDSLEDPIKIEDQDMDSIPDMLLPEHGFFVTEPIDYQEDTMMEATNRDSFVLQIQFEPKNPQRAHRLNCKDYGDCILCLNSLITCTLPDGSTFSEGAEYLNVDLDVVTPAAKGSLRVLLEASMVEVDMIDPHHSLVSALKRVDLAVGLTNDADSIKQLSDDHGDEFAKKFLKFMQVLNRSNVDLRYSWAEPRSQTGNSEKMTVNSVQNLVASIKAKSTEELSTVVRQVQGQFVRFARSTGKWGLQTEDGLVVGIVEKDERPTKLDGLEVGAYYTFECFEKQTFDQAWRNAKPTLILNTIHEIKIDHDS